MRTDRNYHPVTILHWLQLLFFRTWSMGIILPMSFYTWSIITGILPGFRNMRRAKITKGFHQYYGSLLFGIHPLHVESVPGSPGGKICFHFIYLLSLISYIKYLDQRHARTDFFPPFFHFISLSKEWRKPACYSCRVDYLFNRKWQTETDPWKNPFFFYRSFGFLL